MLKSLSKVGAFALAIGLILAGVALVAVVSEPITGAEWPSFVAAPVVFVLFLSGYLMPTIVAAKAGHPNLTVIVLLNIFTGWSLLGWIVSMFWSVQVLGASRCDQCKEVIRKDALICKHCQASVAQAEV